MRQWKNKRVMKHMEERMKKIGQIVGYLVPGRILRTW